MKYKALSACSLICSILLSGCSLPFAQTSAAEQQIQEEASDQTFGEAADNTARPMKPVIAEASDTEQEQASTDGESIIASVSEPEGSASEENSAQEQTAESNPEAEAILHSMSLEEKAAQLFFITPEALTGVGTATQAGETTRAAFEKTPVGGIIYFAQNLEDEAQVTAMLSDMQAISRDRIGLPVFTGVDEEGGTVARISGTGKFDVPEIQDMCEIGAAGNTDAAYEVGVEIGTYLSRMGFNLDFAPDADVLSNPDNTIVKQRSFGSDPENVSAMALAVAEGLNSCGVTACCKHFPGHGATEGDTHAGYAYTNKSLEELEACELVPFSDWIRNNAGIIMVGHISLPNVTGEETPASMSPAIITDLLREQMGYDGVVITDALNMGAITAEYSSAEAAVAALLAGADMLLTPENFQEAYQGVLDAVENGIISEERIDESVMRILTLKLSMK